MIVLFALAVPVFSQSLSINSALRYASEFLCSRAVERGHDGRISSKSFSDQLHVVFASSQSVVIAEKGGGEFAVVSGSDDSPLIAAYGPLSGNELPDGLLSMLRFSKPTVSSVANNVLWAKQDGFSLPIAPLVSSVRHQSDPYNRLCPYYIFDDGSISTDRSLVGCVATATEQVVSHYRFPSALFDSIAGFESDNNGVIPTIPAGTPIDFHNILNTYHEGEYNEEQAMAVAELSYYLGIACRMSWAPGASGANLSRMVEPLRRAFGYKYARCISSTDYSPRRWFDLLLNELQSSRPIVYAGYTTHGGGHAFVVDGINVDGFFHITWGYGGNYDGYFDLSVLTPQENPLEPTLEGIVTGLCHLQEALFLSPDSVGYVTDDTLSVCQRFEIDTVTFNRFPDTNAYIEARIRLRNISDEDAWSPVELFTYTEVDSTNYPIDIDYLGLADAIVPAHADTTLVAYLQFREAGNRFLGLNTVDSMYLPFAPITVNKASQPKLTFLVIDKEITPETASFSVSVSNTSPSYWSGRMVTYSIFQGPYTEDEGDWRHFTLFNIPPLKESVDNVMFSHLKPSTDYTLVIRNPWNPAMQYSFTTPATTAVAHLMQASPVSPRKQSYQVNHRISIYYDESTGRYRQVLRRR